MDKSAFLTWAGNPDNSIHANPLTTPAHIVPEWYFLALYAILRSIPNKQAGVVAVALVIFTLILLGWGSMVSKNRCVTGAGQPLPIPRGVYAIADALHLFWILGAGVLIRMGTFSFGQAASSHQFLLDVGMAGTLVASVTPIHSLGACSG